MTAFPEMKSRLSADMRFTLVTVCALGSLLVTPWCRTAWAAPSANARAAAAQAFDEAVVHFDHAEYGEAARGFLHADELAPNEDALQNAIQAAKKANDHLLVVRASERALELGGTGELATLARDSLAEASRNLAHLDLACEPAPCSLSLDGNGVPAGTRYVLPGTHAALARAADGTQSGERLSLIAGASYKVVLFATLAGQKSQAAAVSEQPPPPKPARAEPSRDAAARPPDRTSAGKPLSPAVFYVGVGATAILAGLTTWSGLDTLSAKSDLPAHPTQDQEDAVYGKAHRSTALFSGAVVVGGLTIASAFLWVDWGNGRGSSAAVVPIPGGALGAAQGRF